MVVAAAAAVAAVPDNGEGPIIGDPIGVDGLKADLAHEMIPYTPEELIAIAEREYAFSLSEAKKAAREMGFGDNWKAAMEKVKDTYVEPGKQPELIRDLARQAEAFFDAARLGDDSAARARRLAHGDDVARAPEASSPFFLGGEQILVSYPTADMSDEDKLMSMRGNNPHFSHATVFHELNPGHHLQGFMSARYNQHRRHVPHAVLERRPVAVLGDVPLGSRLPRDARGSHGRAVLAHAPQRANHLLAQLPSREDDAGAGDSVPRRHGRFRARERRGRSAPLVQRQLFAALSDRLHDRRSRAARAAHELVDSKKMTERAVPRRGAAGRPDADRDGARAAGEDAAHAQRRRAMAVRRAFARANSVSEQVILVFSFPDISVTVNRRSFLKTSAAAAAASALVTGRAGALVMPATEPLTPPPSADLRDLALKAIDAAKAAGAEYADVRIAQNRSQFVQTRERRVQGLADTETFGVGVRTLVNGAWGFAATADLLDRRRRRARRARPSRRRRRTAPRVDAADHARARTARRRRASGRARSRSIRSTFRSPTRSRCCSPRTRPR